jgi:hypothetical protein
MMDIQAICKLISHTCTWADTKMLTRIMYATQQHTAAVRDRNDALAVLTRCMTITQTTSRSGGSVSSVTEELLEQSKIYTHA